MELVYYRTDKQGGQESKVSLSEVRKRIDGYYKSIDQAIVDLKKGEILQTNFAYYKAEEK